MNGPDHYREAELWLIAPNRRTLASDIAAAYAACAQAHATLALVAATVDQRANLPMGEWAEVTR